MTSWVVGALALGTYLLRLAGLVVRGRFSVPERLRGLLDLAATVLIAALVATATLTEGAGFSGWARPVGVGLGVLAAWRRLPLVVVVLVAAGATAALRLLGIR